MCRSVHRFHTEGTGAGCSGSKLLGVCKLDLYYPCEKLGVVTFVYNRSTGEGGEPDPPELAGLIGVNW